MTDKSLAVINSAMPAISIGEAVERYNAITKFVQTVMVKDKDYGVIPGTGNKPTLYKPGAEKLCTLFGLHPVFNSISQMTEWEKGFFYFQYRCDLVKAGETIASGIGSCNSKEVKYRYRQSTRVCPACGKATIIKGKAEYGGGWICFAKKGGCGAKFKTGDQSIEGQAQGQVENTEPYDLVNTIDKMAQKRAFVAATLIGANASEFFTQDVEDMAIIEGQFTDVPPDIGPDFDAPPSAPKPTNGHAPAQAAIIPPSQKLWSRWYTLTAEAKLAGVEFRDLNNDVSSETLIQRGKELAAAIEAKKAQAPA